MKRSKHNLSHFRLQSLDLGILEPCALLEVLPGDTFRVSTSALVRLSPLVAPLMHPVEVCYWWFFVPNRLVWTNWESFITNADSGLTVPTVPLVTAGAATLAYSAARKLGFGAAEGDSGTTYPTTINANVLPLRGVNQIRNEFFRDQDIDAAAVENVGNGPDSAADYPALALRWRKDYFTTARTSPQKGTEASVPVLGIGIVNTSDPVASGDILQSDGTTVTAPFHSSAVSAFRIQAPTDTVGAVPMVRMDIEDWRVAMARQRWREHRNRYGSRYTDYLASLGVSASDARLQRPELIGSGRQVVSVSEVLSTADTGTGVVGDMAGHGIAGMRTRPWQKFFEEHGYVIGFCAVRPITLYANAVPRHWYRATWEDFWQKEMEIEGDQPILKKELNAAEAVASQNTVFGYQRRHQEYRHELGAVVGDFTSTLDAWNLSRIWDANTGPALNSSFLAMGNTEFLRAFADQTSDNVRMMLHHHVAARRLVSGKGRF